MITLLVVALVLATVIVLAFADVTRAQARISRSDPGSEVHDLGDVAPGTDCSDGGGSDCS